MLKMNFSEVDRLLQAMKQYQGNVEEVINDVLHNEAGDLAQAEIYRLMPVSDKKVGAHAKHSKSLRNINGNLSVTVTTTSKFEYLYFPNDGRTTRFHVGKNGVPLEFFERGGEAVQDEIVDRCIGRLVTEFEKGV